MVTMVTTPKSAGVSRCARMTVPDQLDHETDPRGRYRRCSSPNGEAAQFAAYSGRENGTTGAGSGHCLSGVEPSSITIARLANIWSAGRRMTNKLLYPRPDNASTQTHLLVFGTFRDLRPSCPRRTMSDFPEHDGLTAVKPIRDRHACADHTLRGEGAVSRSPAWPTPRRSGDIRTRYSGCD